MTNIRGWMHPTFHLWPRSNAVSAWVFKRRHPTMSLACEFSHRPRAVGGSTAVASRPARYGIHEPGEFSKAARGAPVTWTD
jgi:hypothetical protein